MGWDRVAWTSQPLSGTPPGACLIDLGYSISFRTVPQSPVVTR